MEEKVRWMVEEEVSWMAEVSELDGGGSELDGRGE